MTDQLGGFHSQGPRVSPTVKSATSPEERLWQLTEISQLRRLYEDEVRKTRGKGTDRVDHRHFLGDFDAQAAIIRRKSTNGSYSFAPYAELLRSKGRNRCPRVISIPTIRDRLLLAVLKDILHEWFADRVPRALPNTHVRKVREAFETYAPVRNIFVLKADIKDFYGSINHRKLREQLQARLGDGVVTKLIMRAVTTPTVAPGCRREFNPRQLSRSGVPQGLSISNVLANIYAGPLDDALENLKPLFFRRYVDDILIAVPEKRLGSAERGLSDTLAALGLEENKGKRLRQRADETFDYLGYRFEWPKISVRPASVDRFLAGVAARLTSFAAGEKRFRAEHPWVDPATYREVLVEDLNEKITGATAGKRRYGWLFYFLEMNDLELLHSMDNAIRSMTDRLPSHHLGVLRGLKSLATAYFEARFRPRGRYIMQYDSIKTFAQKMAFLSKRGHLAPGSANAQEVEELFDRIQRRRLAQLDADVGFIS